MSVVVETPEVVPKPCNLFFIGQLWGGAPRAAPPFHVYPSGGSRYHLLFTRPAFVTRRISATEPLSKPSPCTCTSSPWPPICRIPQTCKSSWANKSFTSFPRWILHLYPDIVQKFKTITFHCEVLFSFFGGSISRPPPPLPLPRRSGKKYLF